MARHLPHPLSGPVPLLPTMFEEGRIDETAQRRLSGRIVSAGISTVVVGGPEGEAPTLSAREFAAVIAIALDVGGIVGASICCSATQAACHLAREIADAGASFLLLSPPAYNRPTLAGVQAHLEAVARACDLPIVLRDEPARTRITLNADWIGELSRQGIVSALVLPPGEMNMARRIEALDQGGVRSIAGSDFDAVLRQCDDGTAWLSGAAAIDPVRCGEFHRARRGNDGRAASRLGRDLRLLMRALEMDEPAVTMKAALERLGIGRCELRLPLVPAPEDVRQLISRAVSSLGLADAEGASAPC